MVDSYGDTFNLLIDLATERHQWLHNIIQIEEYSAPVLQLSPLNKHHVLYNMLYNIFYLSIYIYIYVL